MLISAQVNVKNILEYLDNEIKEKSIRWIDLLIDKTYIEKNPVEISDEMENDYNDISHKEYVDKILHEHNFYLDYVEGGGWGPCKDNFYEVWKRN